MNKWISLSLIFGGLLVLAFAATWICVAGIFGHVNYTTTYPLAKMHYGGHLWYRHLTPVTYYYYPSAWFKWVFTSLVSFAYVVVATFALLLWWEDVK